VGRALDVLATLLAQLLLWLYEREKRRDERRRQSEVQGLRDDPVDWWRSHFGVDGADDIRLRDAAAAARAEADQAAARDRAD
jgi:hypothetical protein